MFDNDHISEELTETKLHSKKVIDTNLLMFNQLEMKSQNRFLSALSESDWQRWEPKLQPVKLLAGQVVYESGLIIPYVIFPTTAIVSLLHILGDGECSEIASTGCDGLVGVSIFMGGDSTPSRGVVQQPGQGYRISTQFIKDEFHRSVAIMELMLRYTQALMTQMSQLAVCRCHHSLEQQLCRWILFNLELVEAPQLAITQEQISHRLGVRREGVTRAAGNLQKLGIIHYSRGLLTTDNKIELHAHACECFDVVQKEYDRLLPKDISSGVSLFSTY
jgi:CRP-like cAMP-binding protein